MTVQPTRDQLRALADKATPGPWSYADYGDPNPEHWPVGLIETDGGEEAWTCDTALAMSEPDAAFIAAARTAVPQLLDQLDQAEHRIARLEAQTSIRGRAVVMYRERAREAEAERDEWRQTALDERGAALDLIDQVKIRDARIEAVRGVHYPAHNDPTRTPFCETCKGAPGVHECGCWQDEQQLPVCGHCRGWKGMGPVEWPCATIRALD